MEYTEIFFDLGRLLRRIPPRNDRDLQALKEGAVFSGWIYPSAISKGRSCSALSEIEGSVDEGPSESEVLVEAEGNGAVFLLSSI